MNIRELLEKVKNAPSPLTRDESIPDDMTTDKKLKALRRQWRVEHEIEEKQYLEAAIRERQRERERQMFTGGPNQLANRAGGGVRRSPKQSKNITYYGRAKVL